MKISLMVTVLLSVKRPTKLGAKKAEQPCLRVTHCLYLIHIPIILHEDMNSELWSVQECKLHKISINTIKGP